MNKYQEALNAIKECGVVESIWNSKIENYCRNEVETLQELVDKATPKKPLDIIFNNFGMGEKIGRCPNCKILVNQFQSHCKCDQKLDWNKDE